MAEVQQPPADRAALAAWPQPAWSARGREARRQQQGAALLAALQDALRQGAQALPPGLALQPGARGMALALRRRLRQSGDITALDRLLRAAWPQVALPGDETWLDAARHEAPGLVPPSRLRRLALQLAEAEPEAAGDLLEGLPPHALGELAGMLREAGQASAARPVLWRLLEGGAATPQQHVDLSQLEAAAGADPLPPLAAGIDRHPGHGLLHVERAKLLAARGESEAALADADIALRDARAAAPVLLGAADLLLYAGSPAEGVARLLQAVERQPGLLPLRNRAVQALNAAGRREEADDLAERGLHLLSGTERRLAEAQLLARRAQPGRAMALLKPLAGQALPPAQSADLVQALVQCNWGTPPEYADWTQLADLPRAALAAGPALSEERLWEAARLFIRLERPAMLRSLADLAARRRAETRHEGIGPELALLARELLTLGGQPWHGFLADPAGCGAPGLARLLGAQALALQATGREWRARFCFALAATLDPEDPAARYNAGFAALAEGRPEEARRLFEGLVRIYEPDMARVAWPCLGGQAWPHAPLPGLAAFEAQKPAGRDWPLITVITPSYNQAAYLEETLLSVLNQGYPRLQYIVVDGLSQDGSDRVIARHRDRLDTVIIERDRGQTEAINKGLRLARGELVTWLNSDDMLAPGALHVMALAWLREGGDLIFGATLAHRTHGFQIANLPRATQESFTLAHLGAIFRYWMKGFFFYQPEVFFSRTILEQVGLLREDLYYTMDYEFWLRCAAAGARVQPVSWPIALFRQHEAQKTANLTDCILEQAQVRDRFLRLEPPAERRQAVRQALAGALAGARPRIGIVSSRLDKIFSADVPPDLAQALAGQGLEVALVRSPEALPFRPDLLIKLLHLQEDAAEIAAFRAAMPGVPVVGWFWDNHHHLFANYEVAELLDVAVPGHAFARHYLQNDQALEAPAAPLCITQWSRREAAALWPGLAARPRQDALYGGFVRYAFAHKRNALIEALIAAGHEAIYVLEEAMIERYFGLSQPERFAEWARYKTSLTLPLEGDLSQRLFDALLAGQVPLVPRDVHDLDAVIPPALQQSLPVIRFDAYDIASVEAAHRAALAAFDRGGAAGALARHRFALEGHSFNTRIGEIVQALRGLAEAN